MNRNGPRTIDPCLWVLFAVACAARAAPLDIREAAYGELLPAGGGAAALWTASSGWKIGRTRPPPTRTTDVVSVSAAANEAEAVQLILTPNVELREVRPEVSQLRGPKGAVLPVSAVDLLRVRYVEVRQPTDPQSAAGPWPDPLPPIQGPLTLEPGVNHPLWIRVRPPRDAAAGVYSGTVALAASGWTAAVPLRVRVYGFALPDRPTCVSAFGLNPQRIERYHGLKEEVHRRAVFEKYLANFAAHRISPYDPAPYDPIRPRWPDVRPPPTPWSGWSGGRVVTNEAGRGRGALFLFDDRPDSAVAASWRTPIPIPAAGLRLRLRYRTAVPDHEFIVSLNHYDVSNRWMSGGNLDLPLRGNGLWQTFEATVTNFPARAAFVRPHLYATVWRDDGAPTGAVWIDDVELLDCATFSNLVTGGDFEPPGPRPAVAPSERLRVEFDFTAWDRAMERAMDVHHFTSFKVPFPGLGGGTYEGAAEPQILGFREIDAEYEPLMASYGRALSDHLRRRGWLDRAYVYWFDEPAPHQYEYVRRGFEKIRRWAPGLRGMLTEQVEPALVGGPHIWCPLTPQFDPVVAAERRRHGEQFWWYVCCGPKAPYATLFIDHPGTEMRVWLWQTWQRGIEGILIWETVYWTSEMAYPDRDRPQNPYEDPMSWASHGGKPGTRKPWGNGDGRLLYPPESCADGHPTVPVLEGPVDSIRWEMLRDGVEDYEYLAELRRRIEAVRASLPAARLAELEALLEVPAEITSSLTEFTRDPAPIERRRDEIARAIESLSAP